MKWLTRLYKKKQDTTFKEAERLVNLDNADDEENVIDEVYEATFNSDDIERKVRAAEIHTNNIMHRNLLLQSIVSESYRLRKDDYYLKLCIKFSEMHLSEFNKVADVYMRVNRQFLTVPVFQNYATVLTEIGDFEKAIHIYERAISFR